MLHGMGDERFVALVAAVAQRGDACVTYDRAEPPNYPFDEVAANAQQFIEMGALVFFKFTCRACGSRQTFEVPNVLYSYGRCEECGHTTDLRQAGCNFAIVAVR